MTAAALIDASGSRGISRDYMAPAARATGAGDGRLAVVPAAYDSITEATSQRGECNRLLSGRLCP